MCLRKTIYKMMNVVYVRFEAIDFGKMKLIYLKYNRIKINKKKDGRNACTF